MLISLINRRKKSNDLKIQFARLEADAYKDGNLDSIEKERMINYEHIEKKSETNSAYKVETREISRSVKKLSLSTNDWKFSFGGI